MTNFNAARALAELSAQRAALRDMAMRCEELTGEVEAGRCGLTQLTREISRLRLALVAHNEFEERSLRPLLEQRGLSAEQLDHLIDACVREHRAMQQGLCARPIFDLRNVITTLREHLDADEARMMSPLH